jgi:hypothetical protein
MADEAIDRLLDYGLRRCWPANRWSVRFRISATAPTEQRPEPIASSVRVDLATGTYETVPVEAA